MANEDLKGFTVSPARVAFLLSLIALLTFGWKPVAWVMEQNYAIKSHGEYIVEDKVVTKEILSEVKQISRKVDELTFIVKGVEASKQQASNGPAYQ